jgi:hypothetical protein
MITKKNLLIALVCVCGIPHLFAQTVYTLTGTFNTSTLPTYVAPGDTFTVTFALNLSAPDITIHPDENQETFSAIANLTFNLVSGATGTYPGGSGAAVFTLNDNLGGHDYAGAATKAFPTPAFPAAGTAPFYQILIDFTYLNANFVSLVPSTGQSLGSVLTSPLNRSDFSQANITMYFDGVNQEARGTISSIQASAIPEPSVYALTASAAAFGFVALRKRKRADAGE